LKKIIGITLIFMLLFVFLIGTCVGIAQTVRLSFGTASATGTYYPIGAAISQVLRKHETGIDILAMTSGGSVENIKLTSSGELDIGLANQMHFSMARKGVKPYTEPITNLRTLFPLAGTNYVMKHAWHLVVPVNSSIKSLGDLKGKKVVVGPAGSGTEVYTRLILGSIGLTYEDIIPMFLSYEGGNQALQDGIADAACLHSAVPIGALQALGTKMEVRLISLSEDEIDKAIKDWGFNKRTISPGSYQWLNEPVETVVASYHVVFVNKDMDEDVAYRIVKAVMENVEEIYNSNPAAKNVDAKGVEIGLNAPPLHPGALRYFREIGINVPDSVIPPEVE